MVREGFVEKVSFGQKPEEQKEQGLQLSGGRTSQAEGQASAKILEIETYLQCSGKSKGICLLVWALFSVLFCFFNLYELTTFKN